MKKLYMAVLCASLMASPLAYAAPVNINTADAKTLDKELKGVSPKTAEAIVTHRAKHGPFKSVDDLTKVKGIGRATIEKNRSNIVLK
jgi:competence protein ComEA